MGPYHHDPLRAAALQLFRSLASRKLWLLGLGAGSAVAVVVYALCFAGAFGQTFLDKRALADRILASPEIQAANNSRDRQYATNISNDCIFLFSLIADDYPDRLSEAIAALRASESLPGGAELNHCGRTLLAARQLATTGEVSLATDYYFQYLFGYRPLAAAGLALVSYETLSLALLIAAYLAVGALALIGLFRVTRGTDEGIVWVSLAFAFGLLFGLPAFGGRVTDAFWGLAILAFLVLMAALRAPPTIRAYAFISGLLGALIAQFEFLLGAAPLGLAVVIAMPSLLASSGSGHGERENWDRTVAGGLAFVTAFSASFIIKLALVALLMRGYGFGEFGTDLASRAGGSPWAEIDARILDRYGIDLSQTSTYSPVSIAFMFAKLLASARNLSFDSYVLSLGGLAVSAAAGIYGARGLWRARGEAPNATVLVSLTLSVLIIFVWYLVFAGHTIVHSRFMDRLLVWPAAAGLVAAAFVERRRIGAALRQGSALSESRGR